jgi:hypothetical protein
VIKIVLVFAYDYRDFQQTLRWAEKKKGWERVGRGVLQDDDTRYHFRWVVGLESILGAREPIVWTTERFLYERRLDDEVSKVYAEELERTTPQERTVVRPWGDSDHRLGLA